VIPDGSAQKIQDWAARFGQWDQASDLSIRSTLIESIVPRTAPVVLVDAQFEIELSASA
jgi:hypothetical protein